MNKINFTNFHKNKTALLKKAAIASLKSEKIKKYEINFIMVSDAEIKKLNIKYRRVRRITDVISFLVSKDYTPSLRPPSRNLAVKDKIADQVRNDKTGRLGMSDFFIGDVYISKGRSQKNAVSFGNSWDKELAYLVIHGVLHLCGYTDYDVKNKTKMFAKQDKIFQCLFW